MTTYTAFTTLSDKSQAQALADALERMTPAPMGVGNFEIEDGSGLWEIGGYFTDPPDRAGLALLEALFGCGEFVVSEVPDVDWVAKVRRTLRPVEAGRYFVYGGHDADKVPAGRIALLIEAAMAFGTGHHGTTQGCLMALDRLVENGFVPGHVADVGCGTAVLAMAAAQSFPNARVVASDIDPVAVDVARANLSANDMQDLVICDVGAGFEAETLRDGPAFDLIFANILKAPLIDLAPHMNAHMASGGFAILSGILNEQAEEVIEVYARQGFNLEDSTQIVDWSTLCLRKI